MEPTTELITDLITESTTSAVEVLAHTAVLNQYVTMGIIFACTVAIITTLIFRRV